MRLRTDETIDAVLRKWPLAIGVLLKHRMACVGCAIAPYHTVRDVSTEYGTDCDEFLRELDAASDVTER